MEELPDQMTLSALEQRCISEINKNLRREPSNDQYCLEIFKRALSKKDPQAWELLQRSFSTIVLAWLRRHPTRDTAYRFDTEENYVAQTFSRFGYAVRDKQLELTTLNATLSYLHATLNSIVMDTLRSHLRSKEVPLPEPGFPEEPMVEEPIESDILWNIQSLLPDERERRVAYLLYSCGLKPREIVMYCPKEFGDVKEVYRLRRNIVERLSHNRDSIRARIESSSAPALESVIGSGAFSNVQEIYESQQAISEQLPNKAASTASSTTEIIGSDQTKILSLFALARTTLEDGDRAIVGKTYSIRAGISQSKPESFKGVPFELLMRKPAEPIPFDLVIHSSKNIELKDWQKHLLYELPKLEPQLVDFTFKAVAAGYSSLAVNFYHERRWLKTIRFEFDAIEQFQLITVTSEG